MSTFPLVVYHTIKVEGNIYVVGNSQTMTNNDSFNVVTAKRTFTCNNPSGLSRTPNVPHASSYNDTEVHSSGNQHDHTLEAKESSHRTSTSSSISAEHSYPPLPWLNAQIQRDLHPYSNISSDSLDVQESIASTIKFADTTPTMENLRQYIFGKIKWWFDKLFSHLF